MTIIELFVCYLKVFNKFSTELKGFFHKRLLGICQTEKTLYLVKKKGKKTAKKIMMHNESCSMSYLFYDRIKGGGRGAKII
jgi:hypothetical protein